LGVLIHEKSKQPGLLINRTLVSFRFVEGVLHVAHKLRHRMAKEGKKTLLITSVAENEGKTTLSANLALAMAKHGSKVALVDLDLRRPAIHKFFSETKPYLNLVQVMSEGVIPYQEDNLYIFSLPQGMGDVGKFLHDAALGKFLRDLSESMDFVILDSAPYSAVADSGMLLKYADGCILCVRQDWVPGDVLQAVARELDEGAAEYMGYVLNDYLDDGSLRNSHKKYEQYKYNRK
jgi:capsular exopolysaccharide synthesis family protein